jgi:hypothetical protein
MQRKDYQLIADVIVATQKRITLDETCSQANRVQQLRGVRRAAAHLADALGSTNPRFDKTRFLKACGYGAEKVPTKIIGHESKGGRKGSILMRTDEPKVYASLADRYKD